MIGEPGTEREGKKLLPDFVHLDNRNGPRVIEGRVIEDAEFLSCFTVSADTPDARTIIRNVRLRNCGQGACSFSTTEFDDVLVDGLRTMSRHPLFFWGCVFKHVVILGQIGSWKLNRWASNYTRSGLQQVWDTFSRAFYHDLDWALDLSAAKFSAGLDFVCVPGRLIRRDRETQVLVRRDRVEQSDWRALDWRGSSLRVGLEWFLEYGLFDDTVLLAPRLAKYFKRDMEAINMLRREGIAEAD